MGSETLGHYEILEPLGRGGMGEVFRARDTKLERDVAIKVLPEDFVNDEDRLARFEREAKLLAALNHPNIATIHNLEEDGDTHFLVLELVKGVPLDRRLGKGSLSIEEALDLGRQAAEALEAAHAEGIIHRDLKPANIIVTPEGRVKVLDFGVAKIVQPKGDLAGTAHETDLTMAGKLVGTAPYMSPEQIRGRPADVRSDIWSFGCVLFEALSGRPAFVRNTAAETMSAILEHEPDFDALPASTPPATRDLVAACLDKDPDRRPSTAAEIRRLFESPGIGIDTARRVDDQPGGYRRAWAMAGVAVAVIVVALVAMWISAPYTTSDGMPRITSIAVLPLANLSGDPGQEYFADGMTDALINDLSQVGSLRVISRTSMMRYKDSDKDIAEIARELEVDAVVEGSILREGGRVAVTAQLIDADTEEGLWAERYERDVTSVLVLQREVAEAIVGGIALELTPEEHSRLTGGREVDPEMYEAYLRGMHELGKGTTDGYRAGIAWLQAAIDADPTDPLAYAGLALGYVRIGHDTGPSDVVFPRAAAAANRALELDPDLAEAHAALADVKMYYEWDWAESKRSFERAVELNPSLAEAYAHYTWWFVLSGRPEEALAAAHRAVELDPLSATFTMWLGGAYWYLGLDNEKGLENIERGFELNPDHPLGGYVYGAIAADQGRLDDAIAAHERTAEIYTSMAWVLAATYAKAGRMDDARRVLETYDENASPEAAYYKACALVPFGELDEVFRLLEVSYEGRGRTMPWIGSDPALRSLHDDPRMMDLMRRMDLRPVPGG